MTLSTRAERIRESATLRVARRALELRAQGVEIVSLGAGEPDYRSPLAAEEACVAALRDGFTRYTAAAGTPELRRALAERYRREHDAPWSEDGVVVTVGAKAALFELALALFGAGQEVVLTAPYWVTYPEQVRFCGAEPVLVETAAEDRFRVRAEAVIAALGPATRAVLLNSPCNPTGGVIDAEDLETIVTECAARDILVIADETYERFVYDGLEFPSAARLAKRYPDSIVVVNSFSKTYSMTGWRVGYLLAPPEIARAVTAIQSHSTSNPTSFAMRGALAALEQCESDVREMVAEFEVRRDLIMDGLAEIPGMRCLPPRGAFYAFPEVSSLFRDEYADSISFAEYLLEAGGVAVVPGAAFGADDYIRLSFACSRESLRRGIERIGQAVAALPAVG